MNLTPRYQAGITITKSGATVTVLPPTTTARVISLSSAVAYLVDSAELDARLDVVEAELTPVSAGLAYNGAGKLVTVTKANGTLTTLAYDGTGRLVTVTTVKADASTVIKTLAYDGAGKLISVTVS